PHQHADAAHPISLLRFRCDWPRNNSAEKRNELAPPHSITSSARERTDAGIVRPRALAVLRLTTSSYLVGTCTGRSAGFSALRIRSTYPAARLNWSRISDPYEISPPPVTYNRRGYTAGNL